MMSWNISNLYKMYKQQYPQVEFLTRYTDKSVIIKTISHTAIHGKTPAIHVMFMLSNETA